MASASSIGTVRGSVCVSVRVRIEVRVSVRARERVKDLCELQGRFETLSMYM